MFRVVIVEDEMILRKGLVHTVDWASMNCVVVGEGGDGEEGLEVIRQELPDIVITDIRMPIMDGFQMLEEAKKIHCFRCIILTSYSDFDYARQAISLQVAEYLLKPVNEKKLHDLIEKLAKEIERERVYSSLANKLYSDDAVVEDSTEIYLIPTETKNYYVDEALQRIKSDYAQKLSVESIAEELGVSPSYLSRKFRETTRHTFLDLLNQYRVQKAIKLLSLGKYRISEVSEFTGFTDYKHFCMVFRKYTNVTPTEFIKGTPSIIIRDAHGQQTR